MNVSLEEARLLFGRWNEEAAPVRVKLSHADLIFDGVGMTELTGNSIRLSGPSWQFTVPLEGAEFVFSDPREIPVASVRDAESAQYELGVAVTLASGDRLMLLEMKREPEIE